VKSETVLMPEHCKL